MKKTVNLKVYYNLSTCKHYLLNHVCLAQIAATEIFITQVCGITIKRPLLKTEPSLHNLKFLKSRKQISEHQEPQIKQRKCVHAVQNSVHVFFLAEFGSSTNNFKNIRGAQSCSGFIYSTVQENDFGVNIGKSCQSRQWTSVK